MFITTNQDHPRRAIIALCDEPDGVLVTPITVNATTETGRSAPFLITWDQLDRVIDDLTAIQAWHINEQGLYDQ